MVVSVLDANSQRVDDMPHGSLLIAGPPIVRVISRPAFDTESVYSYLIPATGLQTPWVRTTHDDPEMLVEFSGRECYLSFGNRQGRKNSQEYISNLIKQGHWSVLEHPHWSFHIENVSRSLTHELIRHRHLEFSQRSQRFVTDEVRFVLPPRLEEIGDESLIAQWVEMVSTAYEHYCTLVDAISSRMLTEGMSKHEERKAIRETARSVLPNATATSLVVSGNARAWRHFLEMRGSEGAEPEIRRLALLILETLRAEAPLLFEDYTVSGSPLCIHTPYPGA